MTKIREMQIRLVAIAVAGILIISIFSSCDKYDQCGKIKYKEVDEYGNTFIWVNERKHEVSEKIYNEFRVSDYICIEY